MYLLVSIALVFYGILPLWGAHRLRNSWEAFRISCSRAFGSPELDFSSLQTDSALPSGPVRLTGKLEAFEAEDRLWVGNDRVSISVWLRGVPVFFLDDQPDAFGPGVEPPRKAEADSLGALPEGTQFLVWGCLVRDGQAHFASTPAQRLLVMAFEGEPSTVLTRAVYAGRATLDYWNSWTPVALGGGFLSFLALATSELGPQGDHVVGMWSLALALLPSTFFLPPGILFFYLFSRLWTRGRTFRAREDLARIGKEGAPGWPAYRSKARWCEGLSLLSLAVGMSINLFLLVGGLRLWFWFP